MAHPADLLKDWTRKLSLDQGPGTPDAQAILFTNRSPDGRSVRIEMYDHSVFELSITELPSPRRASHED
jgi:hypothetical protein